MPAVQRRERARTRSEKVLRWRGQPHFGVENVMRQQHGIELERTDLPA